MHTPTGRTVPGGRSLFASHKKGNAVSHRGSPRTRRGWVAIAAVAGCVVALAVAPVANASPLSPDNFEGDDGNMVVNSPGNTDWQSFGTSATSNPRIAVGVDDPSGPSDNAFGQGTKEDQSTVTVVDGSIPPNKNDLTRFYEASRMNTTNSHTYLYLAWERAVNIGNANLDFEINHNATTGFTGATTGPVTLNRTEGDVLITYDFGGSGTPTLGLLRWLTPNNGHTTSNCYSANTLPCWGNRINLTTAGFAEGAVNTIGITDTVTNANLGVGLFGEAAIDLTGSGVFPSGGGCQQFGSTFVKSRSSSSFTAEIKDFIAPVPVSISNCGSITIHKITQNGDSTFGYTTTGGLTPSTFNLSNGGTQSFPMVNPGSYSISESAQSGWTLAGLSCTSSGSGTSATTSGSTVSVTMGVAGSVDCTYTNHTRKSPSITTTLSDTSAPVGSSVHDSATLAGATSDAGGTVTYTVYTDNACTTGARDAGTVTVTNGTVPDSNALTFNTAGTYYWQASYSGDTNNNAAESACTSEVVTINPLSPNVSTAQSLIPNDTMTLSGATPNAGGTITFNLYAPGDSTCSGTPALTQTVTVTGNGTYATTNTTFTASDTGTWRWAASYSGDTNNNGAASACGTEFFTITNG